MSKNFLKELKNRKKQIFLSKSEQNFGRNKLAQFIQGNSVIKNNQTSHSSQKATNFLKFNSLTKNFMSNFKLSYLAIPVILIMGAGISFAAENSLPGNFLYPVKIHVNEPIESALSISPKSKIDLNSHLAQTRLKEAEQLLSQGKLSPQIKKQLSYLTELENWLSQKFMTLISFIEKNIMIKLKSEFSKLFAKWFSMLVSDSFDVEISEDFTPILKQQGYEINYSYLSGGERTAVALAYRLALNQVINSLLSDIKTKDIIVLDEPTDGFSEQQLDKMIDVLLQLNVNQLIIVSHEQKIEGFVENVIKFKKENGISVVG